MIARLAPDSVRSVLVVGGGAIGCGIARELAGRGLEVTVVERGEPGSEASGAAAGLLAPQAEGIAPGPLLDLAVESRSLFPRLAEELARETGIDAGWRPAGVLRCDPEGLSDLSVFRDQRHAGLKVEDAGPARVAEIGAGLVAPDAGTALFFPDDGIVDPRRLTRALWISAERRGVRFHLGTEARRFRVEGGACRGIETDAGFLGADVVVDAAGAWAAFDRGGAVEVPVEPVRGQIVDLRPAGPRLPCAIQSPDVYLVPRADGKLIVGSTTERVGFRKEVTARGVERLIAAACRLVPSLAAARFAGAWAGLRPASPDELPLLGASSLPGLFLAAGHYRNGILLAPATSILLADALMGRAGSAEAIEAFSPLRFGSEGKNGGRPPANAVFG